MRNKVYIIDSSPTTGTPRFYSRAGSLGILLSATLLAFGLAWGTDQSNNQPGAPFKDPTLKDWKERSFSGNSTYQLVDINGTRVLKGNTEGAASILYKEKTINLNKTPLITWSWKINNIYLDIDEQTRQGDDFPARLYVVVKTGFLPWQTLALNYVWSSNQAMGETWSNPYTDKAKMVVVQTGDSNVGEWVSQTRNIAADFKEQFGQDIEKISGYAVMVDGDNANKKGTAWFADISFGAE